MIETVELKQYECIMLIYFVILAQGWSLTC